MISNTVLFQGKFLGYIIEGRNNANAGTNAISASLKISTTQKGVTPLKIVKTDTSLITPFRTKTFKPIGGVIKLISVTTTTKIPNQIRSKPNDCTNGENIGTVNSIIDIDSNFQGTETWYREVAKSSPPRDKPWYHVLVDQSNLVTYVAERNLEEEISIEPIENPFVIR